MGVDCCHLKRIHWFVVIQKADKEEKIGIVLGQKEERVVIVGPTWHRNIVPSHSKGHTKMSLGINDKKAIILEE